MRYFYLTLILVCGLLLKVTSVLGAESLPFESHDERDARVSSVMSVGAHGTKRPSILPMIGVSIYDGRWKDFISNRYSFGIGLDIPLNNYVSTEVEGGYGKYAISYSNFSHDFTKVDLGASLKLYWFRDGFVRPYVGAGLMAVDYIGMSHGPYYRQLGEYNQWIGSGQLMLGADFAVAHRVSLGARGSVVRPLFGLPRTSDNGSYSLPYYEEAAAINTTFYRLMATIKVTL